MFAEVTLETMLISVGAAGVFALIGVAFLGLTTGRQRVHRRMAGVTARARGAVVEETAVRTSVRRETEKGRFTGIDNLASRIMPRPGQLRTRLERTGLKTSVGQYFLANLVVGVIAGFLVFQGIGNLAAAAIGGLALGLGLPHFFVGYLMKRRKGKFLGQFPEAIDLIVRGLKSGLPVTDSLGVVAEELADPLRSDFRTISDMLSVGKTLEDAMWEAAERIDLPEFSFFVVALSVQRETGGNLAETLENLADILRKRRQMKLKVKALSSEAKASAMIIGALPFIMFGVIYAMSPEYEQALLTDPRGNIMLAVGIFWLGCGIAAMAKMVNFDI